MDAIPPLDAALSGLHVAKPAGVFPFLAEGEGVWVRGVASRSDLHVGRGRDLVADVRADGLGTAANIVAFPGLARRDFAGSHGTVVETILAAPTLPLVVLQWSGGPALPRVVEVLLQGATAERVTCSTAGVVTCQGPARLEVQMAPPADDVTIDTVGEGVRVRFEPARTETASLILAFPGRGGDLGAVSAAARHAASHAVRAARGPSEGLLLRSGLAVVDEGVEWLRARLAGQARRLHGETPSEFALPIGLAASAVGDRDSSEVAVASADGQPMTRALLAARHAAVFGDMAAASECARLLVESGNPGVSSTTLTRLVATELADALHLAGDPSTIATLRSLATPAGAAHSSSRKNGRSAGGRPLPMAGGSSTDGPMRRFRGVLNGEPDPALRHGSTDPDLQAAYRAAASFRTDPDDAWLLWRTLLTGDAAAQHPLTVWDDRGFPDYAEGSLTAELLLALTSGILGLRADSAAGRIRLAPVLPRHLTSFGASGIVVGRSTVAMGCSVAGEVITYELTPERGSVPPLLVFEPSVEGQVTSVRVDGEVADLDLRRAGRRTVVPVQLPLDAVRTVEVRRRSP